MSSTIVHHLRPTDFKHLVVYHQLAGNKGRGIDKSLEVGIKASDLSLTQYVVRDREAVVYEGSSLEMACDVYNGIIRSGPR